MNKVILIGRLTKDPELRYTQGGVAVANFTLAVDRPFTNQQGDREADFIPIVVWRRQAENVAKFLSKGRQTAVEGRLQVRTYDDRDGNRQWRTEVVADNVQFLGSKSDSPNQGYSQDQGFGGSSQGMNQNQAQDDFIGEEVVFSDDDLPF